MRGRAQGGSTRGGNSGERDAAFSLIVSVERLVGGSACGDELGAFAVRFAAR
jgi:hypothetical protein